MSNHHRAIEIARDYSNKLPIFPIILPFSLQRRGPHEQDKNAISRLHFRLGCRIWLIWNIGLFRKPIIHISQSLPTPTSINIDRSAKYLAHRFRQTIYTILGIKININPCKSSRLCLADTPFCRILIV